MKNIKTYEQFIGESKSGVYTIEDCIQEKSLKGLKIEKEFIANHEYLADDANKLFDEIMKMTRKDRLEFYNQVSRPSDKIYENRTSEAAEFISGTSEGSVFNLLNNQCAYNTLDKYIMVVDNKGVVSFGEDELPTDNVEYMKEFYYHDLGLSTGDVLTFSGMFGYNDKLGMEENWDIMKNGWCNEEMFKALYNLYKAYCEKHGYNLVSK